MANFWDINYYWCNHNADHLKKNGKQYQKKGMKTLTEASTALVVFPCLPTLSCWLRSTASVLNEVLCGVCSLFIICQRVSCCICWGPCRVSPNFSSAWVLTISTIMIPLSFLRLLLGHPTYHTFYAWGAEFILLIFLRGWLCGLRFVLEQYRNREWPNELTI